MIKAVFNMIFSKHEMIFRIFVFDFSQTFPTLSKNYQNLSKTT